MDNKKRASRMPVLRIPVIAALFAALMAAGALAYYEEAVYDDPGLEGQQGLVRFRGIYHNVNQLLLHTSNLGMLGDYNADPTSPSGEWPAGSSIEYLFAAGLWVGGVVRESGREDTLVTAAVYQLEFYPKPDPRDIVYETFEGQPSGNRLQDDDADNLYDEDPLDGYDNDGDGLVDEDFAAISQQMYTAVFYDSATSFNRTRTEDFHVPLYLKVRQESYAWTSPAIEDFIGIEYKVTNDGDRSIHNAYIAFMVDGDVGPVRQVPQSYVDDMAAYIDTTVIRREISPEGGEVAVDYHITMGYMYDYPGGEDGDVPGYIGVMFLGHTTDPQGNLAPSEVGIHMFKRWSSGEQDPENDKERYRYMRGVSDTEKTIDPPTTKAADYRFLVSAGRFAEIPAGSTLVFQVAFVCGDPFSDLIANATNAQKVYNGGPMAGPGGQQVFVNWLGSSPPPPPKQRLIAGDGKIFIEWDDYSETVPDPLQRVYDFDGYRIWKAKGWRHESEVPSADQWQLLMDINKKDLPLVDTGLNGIGKYRYVDSDVHNGIPYWYAVTAYDDGSAEVIRNPATGELTPVPRYGSYSQSMQLVYPRGTPARVTGKVRIVPNPYPGMSEEARQTGHAIGDMVEYERDPSGRRVRFLNLPRQATVRIYSLSGDLVWERYFEDPTDPSGEPPGWNLVSRNNQEIVSGIYIVHTESPLGTEINKFVVVR
ncbi:MAG: hypothetical protein PVF95_00615 [bacterium]|jgi:hypothetical protein